MNARPMLFGLIFGVGAALTAGTAQAQVRPDSPMVAARKQVADAQAAVNAAKAALEQAKLKATTTFKTSNPDYAKAEAEMTAAKQEMEVAKVAAQVGARKKPEYLAAATAKAAATEQVRSGTNADTATGEIAKQAGVMSRLEVAALDTDPKYLEAKAKYAEATKALEVYKTQLEEMYKVDPDYQAAQQAMTQAQTNLAQTTESMKQTQKSEAAARSAASSTPRTKSK